MTTVDGLPAHVLLVHAVVVLVPLSALLLVLVAVWPAARTRLIWPAAVVTLVALVSVPVTTDAGEWLEHRIPRSALVHTHTELGDTMLPWVIGLAVVALVIVGRHLAAGRSRSVDPHGGPGAAALAAPVRDTGHQPGGVVATVVVAVLALVVGVGSVVTVYRIGESGAAAAWTGQFSPQPLPRTGAAAPKAD